MLGYDNHFAAIATADHADALRKSYAAGRVPYRSTDADRDGDTAVRPLLAPPFGAPRHGCDAELSERAA
jgi:hypothetical protein